jgi:DNA-directed RNA polymerase III subunit RPC6
MENHAWLQNFLLQNKNRKVYMLFELDPSREVTGGAWYTEQDYDAEFVDVVKQQCLHFILKQGLASLEDVAESVRKSGITQVELRLEEFKQVRFSTSPLSLSL